MFLLVFVQSEGISLNEVNFSFYSFELLFDSAPIKSILLSLFFAIVTTSICILLGYLVAYTLYRSKIKNKFFILLIFILPMWSNLLLRIQAVGSLLEENNILTDILGNIGIHFSLNINGSYLAIIIGMVVTYLPFMILPIYNALEKIDPSLDEAASDLGVPKLKTFFKVTLPLSLKGIISGSIMVFLPAVSGFAIPQILGKGNVLLIGNIIEQSFKNMNYNFGSLLAIILLLLILGSLVIINKTDKEGETLL
ncbi:MAG: ABC transporter permease [Acholeplasmatales bacterium]|jgi:spermidine/putrescine transport system permease protein|nr:ABC transporter permease [Acholeplasmatales bacterium]